jgi:hypothetical protein
VTWDKIVIEGGKATAFYGGQPLARAKEEVLVNPGCDVQLGLFPPGLRWISRDRNTVIIERPPSYQTMAYAPTSRYSAKDHEYFRIPVPWQIYIVRFTSQYPPGLTTFCRPSQLNSADDPLFLYPLPNVGGGGEVCMHVEGQWPKFMEGNPTRAEQSFFMINAMWMSGFNYNMGNIVGDLNRHAEEFRGTAAKCGGDTKKILAKLEKVTLDEVVSWTFPKTGSTPQSYMTEERVGVSAGQKVVDELASRVYGAGRI